MDKLEQFKTSKAYILGDVLASITYVPDRQRDIYTMMQSYLSDKACPDGKEKILKNLADCIEGRPYQQPEGAVKDYYTCAEVEKLGAIMDRFIDEMSEGCADGHLPPAKAIADRVWEEIHVLDEKTGGHLLDTWRREEIHRWMTEACEVLTRELQECEIGQGNLLDLKWR